MRELLRHQVLPAAWSIALSIGSVAAACADGGTAGPLIPEIDRIFAAWSAATPGCAVGVAKDHRTLALRAYGAADLEHHVSNTIDTLFEAGSVSKQFTARAVLQLAEDHKLSLDDPVRKYLPELADYAPSPTIRQMLLHTSGLRDWGEIANIEGWPRGTRAYSDADLLAIMSRQREENFAPGSDWSYNNTGYNLAEIIVSRVSGASLASYTQQRLFDPLGMTHTSWRDDFTRVVRDRAVAYTKKADGYHQFMPFENVYGQGGLITTVGDLLVWNEQMLAPNPSMQGIVGRQLTTGTLTSGRPLTYGFGIFVDQYKGQREISHSGQTAGYAAFLAAYPDSTLSVAVLCNVEGADPRGYTHAIVDLLTTRPVETARAPQVPRTGTAPAVNYIDPRNRLPYKVQLTPEALTLAGVEYTKVGPSLYKHDATSVRLSRDGSELSLLPKFGNDASYRRSSPVTMSPVELQSYAGRYSSSELDGTVLVEVTGERIEVHLGTRTTMTMAPIDDHLFSDGLSSVFLSRDAASQRPVVTLSSIRVWNLRLERQGN